MGPRMPEAERNPGVIPGLGRASARISSVLRGPLRLWDRIRDTVRELKAAYDAADPITQSAAGLFLLLTMLGAGYSLSMFSPPYLAGRPWNVSNVEETLNPIVAQVPPEVQRRLAQGIGLEPESTDVAFVGTSIFPSGLEGLGREVLGLLPPRRRSIGIEIGGPISINQQEGPATTYGLGTLQEVLPRFLGWFGILWPRDNLVGRSVYELRADTATVRLGESRVPLQNVTFAFINKGKKIEVDSKWPVPGQENIRVNVTIDSELDAVREGRDNTGRILQTFGVELDVHGVLSPVGWGGIVRALGSGRERMYTELAPVVQRNVGENWEQAVNGRGDAIAFHGTHGPWQITGVFVQQEQAVLVVDASGEHWEASPCSVMPQVCAVKASQEKSTTPYRFVPRDVPYVLWEITQGDRKVFEAVTIPVVVGGNGPYTVTIIRPDDKKQAEEAASQILADAGMAWYEVNGILYGISPPGDISQDDVAALAQNLFTQNTTSVSLSP